MNYRLYLTLWIMLLFQNLSLGQENQLIFYEFIKDDSVMMFFNERNRFTEKKCADYIRYIKINNKGYMDGCFEDLNHENRLLGKGNYVNGNKEGYFEIFYSNGNIKCRGHYSNNIPIGKWEYFYENGSPERTIKINETEILLIQFFDKKGSLKVNEGNGNFKGYVAGNSIIAKGKIVNGKPNGKWTSTMNKNTIHYKEKFENGKLMSGVFTNAMLGGNSEYNHQSFLNKFFLPNYISSLENYSPQKCEDSVMYISEKYSFDINKFNSFLRVKIDKIIENDFIIGNGSDYSIGDYYLSIQFSVDKEGIAEDFVLLTGWGQKFFSSIKSTIGMFTKFNPNAKTMFFHLKLHIPGGNIYQYNFKFSNNRSF